jgi:hypothetical protein
MLSTFDHTNRQHVARQLTLTASFGGRFATHPTKLTLDSALTLDTVMTVLRNYCAELVRSHDSQPVTGEHLAMCVRSHQMAVRLIQAMLNADPSLNAYDPRTPPSRLAETTLHFLAHSVIAFYRVIASIEHGNA